MKNSTMHQNKPHTLAPYAQNETIKTQLLETPRSNESQCRSQERSALLVEDGQRGLGILPYDVSHGFVRSRSCQPRR